jgi:hypothetical protein
MAREDSDVAEEMQRILAAEGIRFTMADGLVSLFSNLTDEHSQ